MPSTWTLSKLRARYGRRYVSLKNLIYAAMLLNFNFSHYRRTWSSWTLPTRIGIILGLAAFFFSIFAWFYPTTGQELIANLQAINRRPKDFAEVMNERKKAAIIEAVDYKVPSSEILVVKLLREPTIKKGILEYSLEGWSKRSITFSSVSPLVMRASSQSFPGGSCEVHAVVDYLDRTTRQARIRITDLRCGEAGGRQFGTSGFDLGFVSPVNALGVDQIELEKVADDYKVKYANYLARFRPPIEKLQEFGEQNKQ